MINTLYQAEESLLHYLDPRPKLILFAIFLILFFLPLSLFHLSIYLLLLLLITTLLFGPGALLRCLRPILPILILVLFLTPPLYRQGTVLWSPLGFPLVTSLGLARALRLICRFSGITLLFYLLLRSTQPDRFILALRWFGIPFDLALIITVTLRYIPYLSRVYHQVLDAHRLRRAEVDGEQDSGLGRRLRRRLSQRLPVLTSVLIQAVRGIPTLAMALESRGVGRRGRRSNYLILKTGRDLLLDFGVTLLLSVLLGLSAILFH